MDERIQDIAKKMGAKIVAELPDVGHGGLGAAHYATFHRKRMEEIREEEQRQPSPKGHLSVLEIPLSETAVQALVQLAEILSEEGEAGISPTELATHLLSEAAIRQLQELRRLISGREESLQGVAQAEQDEAKAKREYLKAVVRLIKVSSQTRLRNITRATHG